jgi:hypothetical protein
MQTGSATPGGQPARVAWGFLKAGLYEFNPVIDDP